MKKIISLLAALVVACTLSIGLATPANAAVVGETCKNDTAFNSGQTCAGMVTSGSAVTGIRVCTTSVYLDKVQGWANNGIKGISITVKRPNGSVSYSGSLGGSMDRNTCRTTSVYLSQLHGSFVLDATWNVNNRPDGPLHIAGSF